RSCRLRTPGVEIAAADRVVPSTQDADRAGQRAAVGIDVCLVESEISPESREQQLHQLIIVHHFGGGAVQSTQPVAKRRVRQRTKPGLRTRDLRRAAARGEEVDRRRPPLHAQAAGELEGDEGAEAMAEQGQWPSEMWAERLDERINERRQPRERRL